MSITSITLYAQKGIVNYSTRLIVIYRSICIGAGFGGGISGNTFCPLPEGHVPFMLVQHSSPWSHRRARGPIPLIPPKYEHCFGIVTPPTA